MEGRANLPIVPPNLTASDVYYIQGFEGKPYRFSPGQKYSDHQSWLMGNIFPKVFQCVLFFVDISRVCFHRKTRHNNQCFRRTLDRCTFDRSPEFRVSTLIVIGESVVESNAFSVDEPRPDNKP